MTSDGTYSYAYDQDGNMLTQTRISDSQLTSYTWDFRNRLTEVLIKTSGGVTVQDDKFTYDIENRRIGKNTLSGGQSWTAYVDANPFMDFNSSGALLYRYMYGNAIDFLIGRLDTSGNAMWYLTDKLGSVRENADGNGNVLDSITYDTFGNIVSETHPTSGDRFKYTSREWDSEIGQYFYRARYYSPTDGRFESEDPLGFQAADTDLYRYVQNAPTYLKDPKGLDICVILDANWGKALNFGKPVGHIAFIVNSPGGGYDLWSFHAGNQTTRNDNLEHYFFTTLQDALAWAKKHDYTDVKIIQEPNDADKKASAAALKFDGKPYFIAKRNCLNLVYSALSAAGVDVPKPKPLTKPVDYFKKIPGEAQALK